MMLKEIEGLFGVKLFRRRGRGMALTDAGRDLLPRCQTVLGEVSAMGSTLRGSGRPLLRIGVFPHTTNTVLPDVVKRLVAGAVGWRLQVVDGPAQQLVQQLLQADIDLLLGRLPLQVAGGPALDGLSQRVLYEGHLSVVAARSHPLAGRRSLPMDELLNWPWILPGPNSTTRVALDQSFIRRGLEPPTPVVEAPSFFYSLPVVAHSEMLTCCAHAAAVHSGHPTSILPVTVGAERTPVSLIWRKASTEAQRAADWLAQTAA
jgi:DNA-binding transcriptional LysR family regulator